MVWLSATGQDGDRSTLERIFGKLKDSGGLCEMCWSGTWTRSQLGRKETGLKKGEEWNGLGPEDRREDEYKNT